MGFFSRLLGMDQGEDPRQAARSPAGGPGSTALERYRYMLQTAPPETIEQAHQEAFEKLTPEQRRQLLRELAEAAPPNERSAIQATSTDDSRALARVATRAEIRQPGVMERTMSGPSMGGGMGGLGTSLLGSFAAGFVGSMVAQSFFSAMGGFGGFGGEDATASLDPGASADTEGAADADYSDGGDFGDFGGGDFGGGDFDS
jgi:hypothetical protein